MDERDGMSAESPRADEGGTWKAKASSNKVDSEIHNHLDNDMSVEDSASGDKNDSTMDVDSQAEKNSADSLESKPDLIDQYSLESSSQDTQESVKAAAEKDGDVTKEVEKDDDVAKPNFESAPNISMDESQEDHSQDGISDKTGITYKRHFIQEKHVQQGGWQPGQPIEEIYLTDDDLPLQLREMARDVVRRRQERVEDLERRRRNAIRRNLNEGDNSESEHDDVFEDAIDGRDNALLEGEDLHFEWSPMETFRSVEETFTPERTGAVSSYTNPYDAFRSFWDDDVLRIIVEETNRYASRITSAAFQAEWYPTNADEVLCLFAFWMMTGVIRMPTICSYFSTNSLLKTEIFSRITTLKRYNMLHRALHFADTSPASNANPTTDDAASSDRVHCLRPIIDHLNSKFQSNYVLSKDICIDESLTLWKGRLSMKQYIRTKAAKFGIKTFELCESATGYLWSFLVYTGKNSSLAPQLPKSTAIVLKLVQPLLNKGYRLFMDNWFNSPYLARYLKRSGTDCVGTLRPSRIDVPRLVTHASLKQGQLVARHSGDVCVLSWMDKKRITMISTCHGAATGLPRVSSCQTPRREPFKPQSILDYNRSMGGVDLKDQMLEPYLLERKRGSKWYLKLFKRLLNVSIHNSRVLLESSQKVRQDNLTFRLELVHAILNHHHSLVPKTRRAESSHRRTHAIPHIVQSTHWPTHLPQSDADRARNRQTRQKCVICLQEGRKQQKTPFMCESCKVPLCVVNCFKKFHTSM